MERRGRRGWTWRGGGIGPLEDGRVVVGQQGLGGTKQKREEST
jgi:hypothetical protein